MIDEKKIIKKIENRIEAREQSKSDLRKE